MIYANMLLNQYSISEIKLIASLVGVFCANNIGKCRNKKYPSTFLSQKNEKEFMGVYNPRKHKIIVYLKKCKTISDFTKTFIHEWTHSKQRVLSDYGRLDKKFGYDNNPMEIEAHAAEIIWNRKLLNFIRTNFK
jgi:hypothetical protein